MGTFLHHAIVVTAATWVKWGPSDFQKALYKAHEIFGAENVSSPIPSGVFGHYMFIVSPDRCTTHGANVEYPKRTRFLEYLRERDASVEWVEVQFGSSDHEAEVVTSSNNKESA